MTRFINPLSRNNAAYAARNLCKKYPTENEVKKQEKLSVLTMDELIDKKNILLSKLSQLEEEKRLLLEQSNETYYDRERNKTRRELNSYYIKYNNDELNRVGLEIKHRKQPILLRWIDELK